MEAIHVLNMYHSWVPFIDPRKKAHSFFLSLSLSLPLSSISPQTFRKRVYVSKRQHFRFPQVLHLGFFASFHNSGAFFFSSSGTGRKVS